MSDDPSSDGSSNSSAMDGAGVIDFGDPVSMAGAQAAFDSVTIGAIYGGMTDLGLASSGLDLGQVTALPTVILMDQLGSPMGTVNMPAELMPGPGGMSAQEFAAALDQMGVSFEMGPAGLGPGVNVVNSLGDIIGFIRDNELGLGAAINPDFYDGSFGGFPSGGGGYFEQSFDSASPGIGLNVVVSGVPGVDPISGEVTYLPAYPTHVLHQITGFGIGTTTFPIKGNRVLKPGISTADGKLLIDYANTQAIFAGKPAQLLPDFVAGYINGQGCIISLRTGRRRVQADNAQVMPLWSGASAVIWLGMATSGASILYGAGDTITAIDPTTNKTIVVSYWTPLNFWDGSRAVAASQTTWGWKPTGIPGFMNETEAYQGLAYAAGNPGVTQLNGANTSSGYYSLSGQNQPYVPNITTIQNSNGGGGDGNEGGGGNDSGGTG